MTSAILRESLKTRKTTTNDAFCAKIKEDGSKRDMSNLQIRAEEGGMGVGGGKGGGGSRRIECADEVLKKSPSFGTVRLAAVHHVIDFEICFGTTAD